MDMIALDLSKPNLANVLLMRDSPGACIRETYSIITRGIGQYCLRHYTLFENRVLQEIYLLETHQYKVVNRICRKVEIKTTGVAR